MDGEPSVEEEPPKTRPCTRIFHSDFPYFLSIGMTYEEYWFGDPLLVRDYLRAEEYRRKQENYNLWLGGIYMREAIMSSIGNAFIGKGEPAYQYMDKPIPMGEDEIEQARKDQEEKEIQQAEAWMQLIVEQGKNWGKKEPLKTESEL